VIILAIVCDIKWGGIAMGMWSIPKMNETLRLQSLHCIQQL